MTALPLRPETPLVMNAIAALRELVAMPAYVRGSKLPSEVETAKRLGVSRPVLRQALAVLKDEGLIEARRGSGTYARGRRSAVLPFGPPESLSDLEDCMRFRIVIESAAAGEAARIRDARAIKDIRKVFARMGKGVAGAEGVLADDMEFHLAVSRAAHSRYYVMTLETLMPHILFGLNLGRQLGNVPGSLISERVIAEHRAILVGIERGNERQASEAMRQHLVEGIQRIFHNRNW